MNMDMDIDPVSDSEPDNCHMSPEEYYRDVQDKIFEIRLEAPPYYFDDTKMLQADALRHQFPLPEGKSADCAPGYYFLPPDRMAVVSHDRSSASESAATKVETRLERKTILSKQVRPIGSRRSARLLEKKYQALSKARWLAGRSDTIPGDWMDFEIMHSLANPDVEMETDTEMDRDTDDEFDDAEYNHGTIEEDSQVSTSVTPAGSSRPEDVFPVLDEPEEETAAPLVQVTITTDSFPADCPAALFTTQMSWGQPQSNSPHLKQRIWSNLGVETGSALSWVLSKGFKRVEPKRLDRLCSLQSWTAADSVPLHGTAKFPDPVDIYQEYPRSKLIRYADQTAVAHEPLTDTVTFHSCSPEIKVNKLQFLGAMAVSRKLARRQGYEGLFSLGPNVTEAEKLKAGRNIKTVLEQMARPGPSQLIAMKHFFLIFEGSEAVLSLGGISTARSKQFHPWSDDFTVLPPSSIQDVKLTTWALILDKVSVRATDGNNTTLKSKIPEISHQPPASPNPSQVGWIMNFDSGSSHTHFNTPIFSFLENHGLLFKSGEKIYCDMDQAPKLRVSFVFRDKCGTKPFVHEISGLDFAAQTDDMTDTPLVIEKRSARPSTVSATANDSAVNVWGNKNMDRMAIGFSCGSHPKLWFGTAKPRDE
ncbi:hypothetical protein C8J56DRAFT_952979 [Mycena floridula]|nr:hypothetical protein C8J56DRAFT_952979 [Mycena floridula]